MRAFNALWNGEENFFNYNFILKSTLMLLRGLMENFIKMEGKINMSRRTHTFVVLVSLVRNTVHGSVQCYKSLEHYFYME
jgi:hypothetical protein